MGEHSEEDHTSWQFLALVLLPWVGLVLIVLTGIVAATIFFRS